MIEVENKSILNCPPLDIEIDYIPLILYVLTLIIFLVLGLYVIIGLIETDRNDDTVSTTDKLIGALVLVSIHLVGGIIAGFILYNFLKVGNVSQAWTIYWFSIAVPIVLFIFSLLIIEAVTKIKFT